MKVVRSVYSHPRLQESPVVAELSFRMRVLSGDCSIGSPVSSRGAAFALQVKFYPCQAQMPSLIVAMVGTNEVNGKEKIRNDDDNDDTTTEASA